MRRPKRKPLRSKHIRAQVRHGFEPKKLKPLVKDGRVLAVIRPADPQAAIAEARRIVRAGEAGDLSPEQQDVAFQEMLTMQEYRFMGIACIDGVSLLNHDHTKVVGDSMKPGDSFTPYEALMEAQGVTPAKEID